MNILRTIITSAILSLTATAAAAQAMYTGSARVVPEPQPLPAVSVSDSLLRANAQSADDIFDMPVSLPDVFFMPAIYDRYTFFKPLEVGEEVHGDNPAMRWIEDYEVLDRQMNGLRHHLFYTHPEAVRYNLGMLPAPPPVYQVVLDPADYTITLRQVEKTPDAPTIVAEEVKKRHWIRTFTASLQFSQAYVSPNWYQGGNNNLNMLGNIYYNVKLNPKYHPNLLFETTAQYKLGFNSTPDDKVRDFNISDDLFQVNTTLGIKAIKKWYYSFTGQFKTQLFNSYPANSRDIRSSFMSPGDLTAGIGMTYNTTNKPKTITFDASVAPLSYSLRTCINDRIDPTRYNVEKDHKTKSKFGSSADLKLSWKIYYNISLSSHFFTFTDYESLQADWENTVNFDVNRYLSTQIYVHARFDTKTPKVQDSSWKKLQIKEILSFGLTYKFSSI